MGTLLEVELLGGEGADARAAADAAYREIARLERLVSHYDPESAVSRLAEASGRGPREVEPEVSELIRASLLYGELSKGAFDVTLGPAVEFWRNAGDADRLVPDRAAFARVRARTGQDKLRALPGGRVELVARGMQLDFGGIAKGWALDRVVPQLREADVAAALLSFGQSSIWALGAPPGAEGWTLALRSPSGGIQGRVTLRDQALSVGSSVPDAAAAERAPVIHPRTLWPVEQPAFAAVVARDATSADALSTALLVLDPYSGVKLVEAMPGIEAMIVEPQGDVWQTTGWYERARYVESGTPVE
jgi:thiamine biosynthesis lipoprotein